jgi:hypothetical protein
MQQAAALPQASDDPQRFFWYAVWVVIMAVTALPFLGVVTFPQVWEYRWLLLIHELSAFAYVGHTLFSNVWAMRIRLSQPLATGIWARGFLRKLALSITGPTAVITPLFGLLVVEHLGGMMANPWAWDAYFTFWLMAGFSIVPDVIRYGRNRNAGDPRHGVKSGAIRGMLALVIVLYIIVCMVAKVSIFHGLFFG